MVPLRSGQSVRARRRDLFKIRSPSFLAEARKELQALHAFTLSWQWQLLDHGRRRMFLWLQARFILLFRVVQQTIQLFENVVIGVRRGRSWVGRFTDAAMAR